MINRDRHSALKTEITKNFSSGKLPLVLVKLQWSKNEIGYSLHAAPNTYTSAGFQITDFLSYLGFSRERCAFVPGGECYSRWVEEDFDLEKFSAAFGGAFGKMELAERHLNTCGFSLDQPEGWGYFYGKPSEGRRRSQRQHISGDGHTSQKSQLLKKSEDDYFQFLMSWIESPQKGWTFHYRPKHPPISEEIVSVMDLLGFKEFNECPWFDFEACSWLSIPYEQRGDSIFDGNAEVAHRWFDANAQNFSAGVENLIAAQALVAPFDMRFLPIRAASVRQATGKPTTGAVSSDPKGYEYDVALSFAGTERHYAETLASSIRDHGFSVFYDSFYPEQLWGKDLVVFFDEIYQRKSRYCVMFVSSEYCDRMWTNHERRSAQARLLKEKGKEYILPIKVDDAELPGTPPTIGYLPLAQYGIEKIADILVKKLSA